MRHRLTAIAFVSFAGLSFGCMSEAGKENGSVQDRQDAAMKDPFSYGPSQPGGAQKPTTPASPTRDNSARGDWDRVWNP